MTPKFSIIIPVFNSFETIEGTISSILDQTFINFQVIIVDNSSTDGSIERINSIVASDNRFYLKSEPDKGIYDAMNKGIRMAHGEWLYFMGSDDKFYNHQVLDVVSKLVSKTRSNVVYGNVIMNGDSSWAKDGQIYDGEFSLDKLIEKNICHQAIFYKRKILAHGNSYKTEFNICSDWDLNFRLWAKNKFFFTNTIIAIFKGGNSSTYSRNNYTYYDKWVSITDSFCLKILKSDFSDYRADFFNLSQYYIKQQQHFKGLLMLTAYRFHKFRRRG